MVDEPLHLGVFVCDCGPRVAGVVDTEAVAQSARELEGVVLAERLAYSCSKDGLAFIRQAIQAHRLDAVVIAGCTPRTHEGLFRRACATAVAEQTVGQIGHLSPVVGQIANLSYSQGLVLVEMVNIREGCALVHANEPAAATAKAARLVAMAVAKAGYLDPLLHLNVALTQRALVIGGGVAGMTAALALANGGMPVTLVERRAELGGLLRHLSAFYQADAPVAQVLAQKVDAVRAHSLIQVLTHAEVVEVQGTVGKWTVEVSMVSMEETTAQRMEHPDDRTYLFSSSPNRLSVDAGAIIVATGAQALRPSGRYEPAGHQVLTPVELDALKLVPQADAGRVARLLDLPQDKAGFFAEPRRRLRPGTYAEPGIFVAGAAHHPVDTTEAEFQGYRAGIRALRYLRQGRIECEAAVASVDTRLCTGCGTCPSTCPFGAIALQRGESVLSLAVVDPLRCGGCGNCVTACPPKAISMPLYGDSQVLAQIDAALDPRRPTPDHRPRSAVRRLSSVVDVPRILVFGCEWSGYAALELAGARGLSYPANIIPIRLPCSARLDPNHVLWAFLNGAEGVILAGCEPGKCHFGAGNRYARERIERLRHMLADHRFDPNRLQAVWMRPDEPQPILRALDATGNAPYA